MFGLKNSAYAVRVAFVVLMLASLYTLALGVRRFILIGSYGGVPARSVPFTLESALQFRRVKMILELGGLPRHDDMIQRPDGVAPAETYTVFVDYLQAELTRVFPGSLDVSEKLRWIESGWFCLAVPLLVLWGEKGVVNRLFDPINDWLSVATDVHGVTLPSGHFLAEEAPEETLAQLEAFFGA